MLQNIASGPLASPSQQEAEWLPTLVRAYAYFQPLLTERRKEEMQMLRSLAPAQFEQYKKRNTHGQAVGKKYMQLIVYNFLVGERRQPETEFDRVLELLDKWMKRRYGSNLPTVFEVLSKVFHFEETWMVRGVRRDLEALLMMLSSDSSRLELNQVKTTNAIEIKNYSDEDLLSDSSYDEQELSVKLSEYPKKACPILEEKPKVKTSMSSFLDDTMKDQQSTCILDKSSSKLDISNKEEKELQNVLSQKQAIETLEKRPLQTLKKQVNEYLDGMHQYKTELTQFCHQMGFSNPVYSRPEKLPEGFSVGCKMDFTGQHTKFQQRHYETIELGSTAKIAEQTAARKVLSLIYTKHDDLWQRFRRIKTSKNIRIE